MTLYLSLMAFTALFNVLFAWIVARELPQDWSTDARVLAILLAVFWPIGLPVLVCALVNYLCKPS